MKFNKFIMISIIMLIIMGCSLQDKLERKYKNHDYIGIVKIGDELYSKDEDYHDLFEKTNNIYIPFIASKRDNELNKLFEKSFVSYLGSNLSRGQIDNVKSSISTLIGWNYQFADPNSFIGVLFDKNKFNEKDYFNRLQSPMLKDYIEEQYKKSLIQVFYDKIYKFSKSRDFDSCWFIVNRISDCKDPDYLALKDACYNCMAALNFKNNPGDRILEIETNLYKNKEELKEIEKEIVHNEIQFKGMIINKEKAHEPASTITIRGANAIVKFTSLDWELYNKTIGEIVTVYIRKVQYPYTNDFWVGGGTSEIIEHQKKLFDTKNKIKEKEDKLLRLKTINPDEQLTQFESQLNNIISEFNLKNK